MLVLQMAILHPTEDKILLGRNKAWPKGFVSCLAGELLIFVEDGGLRSLPMHATTLVQDFLNLAKL